MPVYPDFDEALHVNGVTVVDICVPTREHPGYIRQALRAGKHVYPKIA